MILLSIVLPIYNVESYIERCIRSIISQEINTHLYEIILVNDGSKDSSLEIAKLTCSGLENVKIIDQENRGLGGARNSGLSITQGEYIWFVDSDDTIEQNSIKLILNNIKSKSDIYIYDVNKRSSSSILEDILYHSPIEVNKGYEITQYFLPTQVWRNIYRRDFLLKHQLYFKENFLHEDAEFNLRAMIQAERVSYKKRVIYNYFTNNSSSIMNNIRLSNQKDLLSYFDTANRLINDQDLNSQQRTCIQRYLEGMLGLLFKNVLYLDIESLEEFKILLKSYQSEILKLISKKKGYSYFKGMLLYYFVSKRFYNLVYNKTFLLS